MYALKRLETGNLFIVKLMRLREFVAGSAETQEVADAGRPSTIQHNIFLFFLSYSFYFMCIIYLHYPYHFYHFDLCNNCSLIVIVQSDSWGKRMDG